jgi:phage FluMu gp28-like protein
MDNKSGLTAASPEPGDLNQASAVPAGQAIEKSRGEDLKTSGGRTSTKAAGKVSPLDLLLPYQSRWVSDAARFKIGVWSRQTGKSFSTACEATTDSLTDPGTKWVCLSAGERQALEWLEKVKEWSTAYRLAIESYAEDRSVAEALLKQAEVKFGNGSRIIAIPANPSTARGYSANVILDEFAYHEDPDKIWSAMFPSLTNPLAGTFMDRVRALYAGESLDIRREMKIRVVSTFNGRGNKFFQLWEKRKENGYSGHMVDIHSAKADGLPVDVDKLREGLDDAEAWAQEYECQPTDTSNVLLPYDLIALAESAEATDGVSSDFWELRPGGANRRTFCGIDFGRTNDPTVCWTWEEIGPLLVTREVLVLKGVSTPDQVAILGSRIRRSTRTCVDYTGPGIGFGDYAAREFQEWEPKAHKFGKVELCTFTVGFKRELFPLFRRGFEAPTRLRVPIARAVREDLHGMQQIVMNGEYNYWAPRTKEGHSDRCTAGALGVRAAGDGQQEVFAIVC